MDNQDILDSNHHQPSNDGETYPISDHDSSIASNDLIDTNNHRQGEDENEEEDEDDEQQLEFAQTISQDSLVNGEQTRGENQVETINAAVPPLPVPTNNNSMTHSRISSRMSTMKSSTGRSLALDEHIKLVKQKKEEAEVLRLQRFQEQLKKKEQKWQQQQLERMKKWLQLRNRDTDHRTQVEERRRKREEEAKAKIDEMIRREKEREHRVTSAQHQLRTATPSHRPDSVMSMSTDILSTRRAISASRLRPTNHLERRGINNHSPVPNSSTDAREETETNASARPRSQIHETFRRLAKPRTTPMAQSVYVGATAHTIPQSRSSHQLRIPTPTPPVHPSARRNVPTRPATVPNSNAESRTSPSDEAASSTTRPKPVTSRPMKAPRSVMTTSHSSSSLSTIKTNVRRIGPASVEPSNGSAASSSSPPPPAPPAPIAPSNTTTTATNNTTEDDHVEDPVTTEEYQRKLNQKIREARQREEDLRRQAEQEEYEREQEQIRLVEEQRRAEQERLQRAIEERERENELKRQEELRLAQQREELERRQAEEMERLQREREERAKREEEERIERKRRLDLIMRRTRQTSPNSKVELPKSNTDSQTNGHESPTPIIAPAPTMTHSMSENRFPSSTSNENFLDTIASPSPVVTETPKFKSPLIQSLLNKARNTRSTDNLIQTSMTTSQIILDQSPLTSEKTSTTSPHPSDDDETNHLLSSSTTTNNNNNSSSMNSSYPADSVVH